MKRAAILAALAACLALPAAAAAQQYMQFYASQVIDYDAGEGSDFFSDPELALGGPYGLGPGDGSFDVVTLGRSGSITLGFEPGTVIADGSGADFIVFENAFLLDPNVFAELVRVRVSSDGTNFAEFPTRCEVPGPVPPFGGIDPALVSGFAGVTPVLANVGDPNNERSPFNPAEAGGDAFDLAEIAGDPLVVGGLVDPNAIRYVQLVDVWGDGGESDSNGDPIYDATGYGMFYHPDAPWELRQLPVSADIDSLAVINGLAESGDLPGDTDEDGDVDWHDYLAVKTHFGFGPGASRLEGDLTGDGYVDFHDYVLVRENFGATGGPGGAGGAVPEPAALTILTLGALVCLRRRTHGR